MGMVTLHLVVGVGVFILPLFLLLFSLVAMSLAHLYIVIGSVSFVASIITSIVLVTKFVNQPEAHGFFSYSDTIASGLMSLGLLLDGILYLLPDYSTPCYQYKVVYGLFIVPIITSFFSILGMSIERFQTFALYRDRRKFTKKFSIAWFLASWTLALCFLVILLAQISEKRVDSGKNLRFVDGNEDNFFIDILDMDLFPGPHSEKKLNKDDEDHAIFHDNQDKNENESVTLALNEAKLPEEDNANFNETAHNGSALAVECLFRYKRNSPSDQLIGRIFRLVKVPDPCDPDKILHLLNGSQTFVAEQYHGGGVETGLGLTNTTKGIQCQISSRPFIMYYLILLFLLCFITPVLITASLNVFIQSAVSHTTYEVISHHQWLILSACVLMWGPSLVDRLLAMWDIASPPLVVSVFLFLLGHTHNLLRSVLHAVFAQQIHSITWRGNQLNFQAEQIRFRWRHSKDNRVKPFSKRSQTEDPRPERPSQDENGARKAQEPGRRQEEDVIEVMEMETN